MEELLRRLALALCRTARLPASGRPPAPTAPAATGGLAPASRRELVLATAARLFQERGFAAVSMEAIGAAAGIAGPSVYNHFGSKADLLEAVFDRGTQTLQLGLIQALATAGSPAQALEFVVRSYVTQALRPDSSLGLLYSEMVHLSTAQVRAARRAQREYIAEWVRLLPADPAEGRVAVQAALSMINGLVLTPHLRRRPGYAEEVISLAMDVLGAAGTGTSAASASGDKAQQPAPSPDVNDS